jgi:predicted transposase/invertase (TIGR01784 family)
MVEDLIRSFVKEDFVREIDFATLKRLNASYVTEEFRERESDIIWEVRIKGRPTFIYLLIEFQSTVDRFMALRLLTYVLLFYQELVKTGRFKKLPSLFPIVLYNGDEKWDAALDIRELIDAPFRSMEPYLPRFSYCKIAENEFSKASLAEVHNLVAKMFLIETSGLVELVDVVEGVLRILRAEIDPLLQRDFGKWLRTMLKRKNIEIDITRLDELEVRPMLLTHIEEFEKKAIAKGKREGMREGMRRGLQNTLVAVAEIRFGEAGSKLASKIRKIAGTEKLEALIELLKRGTSIENFKKQLL